MLSSSIALRHFKRLFSPAVIALSVFCETKKEICHYCEESIVRRVRKGKIKTVYVYEDYGADGKNPFHEKPTYLPTYFDGYWLLLMNSERQNTDLHITMTCLTFGGITLGTNNLFKIK